MAKPEHIILVRHGESVGNVDKSVYEHTPDWRIDLTDKGREQATVAGERVAAIVNPYFNEFELAIWPYQDPARFYTSPWMRARQTCEGVRKAMGHVGVHCRVFEDPRLREQEWGNYQTAPQLRKIWRERDGFGKFFYRMPDGESGADVYDRVSTFLETLHRDFQRQDYPCNTVIVTHGLTMRVFLMRWFHWSVEEYDALCNPPNGAVVVMKYEGPTDGYRLLTKLRKKPGPKLKPRGKGRFETATINLQKSQKTY